VAEAWVNRGPLRAKRVEYRARGAANILKRPSTSKYPLYTSLLPPQFAVEPSEPTPLPIWHAFLALPPCKRADLIPGISLVLKEEKTRIREHRERVAKKYRQGPWVHLPDRPVTAQRPFYSW
jgi:hypothetical protein